MLTSVMGNSVSALQVAQRSLETVSNNIANVNTEGYNRQYLQQSTRVGGGGVQVGGTIRAYHQFTEAQVRSSLSAFGEVDKFFAMASQVDNMMASSETGLMPTMKAFFGSVNDVANNPSSLPTRQVMLSQGEALTNNFNALQSNFGELDVQVAGELNADVNNFNAYIDNIAQLNKDIVANINAAEGNMPNDLLDQRDILINKVAAIADISVLPQSDGSVSMFVGNGQPIVVAADATHISLVGSKFDQTDKSVEINGQDVTDILSGGSLRGILKFKNEILDPAKQQLGLVAVSLATQFNNTALTGYDFNGNEGLAFFDFGAVSPQVQVQGQANDPNLELTATFVAPAAASSLGSQYRLDVTSTLPAAYTLVNLTDNSQLAGLDDTTLPAATQAAGFDITFGGTGSVTIGDSFTISPTYNIAKGIRINPAITRPEQIAAAGSRALSATSATGYAGVPGDNAVAMQLANIESSAFMLNGTVSITENYGNMVSEIGSKTHIASISQKAQETLLKQAQSAKENSNGVNLDQEAADLIKFQQAYQAAAQTISLAKELFQTMMNAMQ